MAIGQNANICTMTVYIIGSKPKTSIEVIINTERDWRNDENSDKTKYLYSVREYFNNEISLRLTLSDVSYSHRSATNYIVVMSRDISIDRYMLGKN